MAILLSEFVQLTMEHVELLIDLATLESVLQGSVEACHHLFRLGGWKVFEKDSSGWTHIKVSLLSAAFAGELFEHSSMCQTVFVLDTGGEAVVVEKCPDGVPDFRRNSLAPFFCYVGQV